MPTPKRKPKRKSTRSARTKDSPPKAISPGSTIEQVAAAANVSTATVSRFFNSPQLLKENTAERIRQVVQRVNYVPNLIAGGLASNRSRLVAAAIPTISQSIFSSTIQALTDTLAQQGYSVMLALTGASDEHVQRQLLSIIGRRPDGIILTGTLLNENSRRQLRATGIPTIETWDLPANPIDLVVGLSHHKVGIAVARRALDTGRRRAFVISASGVRALARRTSFSRTMLDAGAPDPSAATFVGSTTFGQGRRAMADYWDGGGRPEIVVCSSDTSAHGAMDELRRRGVRVPEDVAVIGFGDLEFAAELSPSLTTVKIDGAVIGRRAAEFLMLRARGEKIARPVVDIGFTLVERESG
jgi:LacI family gluconate utilization system Gnt-I transcriptional repressor